MRHNILYVTHMIGNEFAGPTYSVPNQIKAQEKYDNVYWFNAVKKQVTRWESLPYYHDLNEIKHERIASLPYPYNNPDIVIIEGFYNMAMSQILRELINGSTPYIIVPRGELTELAQRKKGFKKSIANIAIFRKFAMKAAAIEYLTQSERETSNLSWNSRSIVIPNGIEIPNKRRIFDGGLRLNYIGRIEPYQKGLDLLIDACNILKEKLIEANAIIGIYGPDEEGKKSKLDERIRRLSLEGLVCLHGPKYGIEKESTLLSTDIFVLTSRFEGHPMALIEALSYGIPCLVTTGSNLRGEIEEFSCGWTADNEAESIALALDKAIQERGKLSAMSENAIALARQYDWANVSKETHRIYSEIINISK